MTATVSTQDTEHLRLFLGDHLAGATWVDAHRGPAHWSATEPDITGGRADTRLRLRLLIGGRIADEAWLDTAAPDAQHLADLTASVHSAGVDAAREYGVLWLIEIYQPSAPPSVAYLRAGSDPGAMERPEALTLGGGE